MKAKELFLNKLNLLALTLVMMVGMALVACGGDDDNDTTTPPNPVNNQDDKTKLTVTNNSGWELGFFYVEFYVVKNDTLNNGLIIPKNELLPGKYSFNSFPIGSTLVLDIPQEANAYLLGTVVDNENYNSGVAKLSSHNVVSLTDEMLRYWGLYAYNDEEN